MSEPYGASPIHRHLDCDPNCQLLMHKGYPTCYVSGECSLFADADAEPADQHNRSNGDE